jgi:hypothetical protein
MPDLAAAITCCWLAFIGNEDSLAGHRQIGRGMLFHLHMDHPNSVVDRVPIFECPFFFLNLDDLAVWCKSGTQVLVCYFGSEVSNS